MGKTEKPYCNNHIMRRLGKLGKEQKWLSEKTGIDKYYISRLCSGKVKHPYIQTCLLIANVLGCFVEDLWDLK